MMPPKHKTSIPNLDGRFGMVPLPAIRDTRMTWKDLAVLIVLFSHRRAKKNDRRFGYAFASQETIASEMGLPSGHSILVSLDNLESSGWIRRASRFEIDPDFRGNPKARAYEVAWEAREDWAERARKAQNARRESWRERRCGSANNVTSTSDEPACGSANPVTSRSAIDVTSDVPIVGPELSIDQSRRADPVNRMTGGAQDRPTIPALPVNVSEVQEPTLPEEEVPPIILEISEALRPYIEATDKQRLAVAGDLFGYYGVTPQQIVDLLKKEPARVEWRRVLWIFSCQGAHSVEVRR